MLFNLTLLKDEQLQGLLIKECRELLAKLGEFQKEKKIKEYRSHIDAILHELERRRLS